MTNSRASGVSKIYAKAIKATSETKTTTTVVVLDSELFVTLAEGTYFFEYVLFFKASANADFRYEAGIGTATATGFQTDEAPDPQAAKATTAMQTLSGISTDGNQEYLKGSGTVVVTGAGTFGILWAQNVSHADTTELTKGSSLVVYSI